MSDSKNFLAVALSVFCASAFYANDAKADCSAAEASQLLQCAHDNAESCRSQFPTCTEPGQVATVQDTIDAVGARCCRFTGKTAKVKQRECFLLEETKLTAMIAKSTKTLKPFLRKSKAGVTKYRRDGCSTGSQN